MREREMTYVDKSTGMVLSQMRAERRKRQQRMADLSARMNAALLRHRQVAHETGASQEDDADGWIPGFKAHEDDPETWEIRTAIWDEFERQTARRVGKYGNLTIYRAPSPSHDESLRAISRRGSQVGAIHYSHAGADEIDGTVSVHPDFRRRGVASALCRMAEKLSARTWRPTMMSYDGTAFQTTWNERHEG